jgi:outer membrane protein OmpA-like peptidoglycan-associated protein
MMSTHSVRISRIVFALTIAFTSHSIVGCSPQAGPDKSVAGTVLGASWGAGLGAVVGNQVNNSGDGVAIGAGFGAVSGMLHGIGYDLQEGNQLQQNRILASLQVQAVANQRHLEKVQANFDNSLGRDPVGGVYQVYFDEDQTNMRMGAVASLETIAESIKATNFVRGVVVSGHTDDTGSMRYNEDLAKARANSVGAYLASRGIPVVQIDIKSFGATKPIATNATAAGRQLNRRVEVSILR